jgi:ubiquinone/menaquinone biosynthesis C-methylase UbiE
MGLDPASQAFADFERVGWEEVAAGYSDQSEVSTAQISEPLLDAAGVRAGTRVLDVATGPGWTAAAAARRGADVIGLDLSAAMLREARARHPALEFRQGAAEELPFEAGSFDVVVSAFGMPHFTDHAAVFRECHRVLRDDGRLAVSSWNPPPVNQFFAIAFGAIAQAGTLDVDLPAGTDMFVWADDDNCAELFSSTGFGPHTRTPVEIMVTSEDATATMIETLEDGSVRSRALYLAQTDDARRAIKAKLTELLAPFEVDGSWTIDASAFVLAAHRLPT